MVASYGHSPEVKAYMATHQIAAGHGSIVGRQSYRAKSFKLPTFWPIQITKWGR